MRRRAAWAALVPLLLLLALACQPTPEPPPAPQPLATTQATTTPTPVGQVAFVIEASATGWAEVTPTIGRYHFTIEVYNPPEPLSLSEAKVVESLSMVMSILSEKGVAPQDVTVYSRYPSINNYVYPARDIRVLFRDLPRLGETLAALSAIPYTKHPDKVYLEGGDPNVYRQTATDNARWLARRQAEELAASRGCSATEFVTVEREVINIEDGKIRVDPLLRTARQAPIAYGELTFPAEVLVVGVKLTLTFELVCAGTGG